MAGKAPLLLASLLFLVGAAGLVLTPVPKAEWGPFQPSARAPQPPATVAAQGKGGSGFAPPHLADLLSNAPIVPPTAAPVRAQQPIPQATPTEEPAPAEPTPTPVPPIRVFGISADDGGASAASLSPTPPPPIFIGGISADDGEAGTGEPTPIAD